MIKDERTYKKMLKAYIEHILAYEGSTFIECIGSIEELSEEENAELLTMAEEAYESHSAALVEEMRMTKAPLSYHVSPSKAPSGNGSDAGLPAVVELRIGQGEV